MSIIGRGATGTVYRLSPTIAVKRAHRGEDEQADHTNEQEFFKELGKYSPIPYLIECYYQSSQSTFLELAPNGNIAMLLNQYQKRSTSGIQVLEVLQNLNRCDLLRWVRQLCCAAASLEKLGLTHGDIRPANMLLDAKNNLKLSDFDRGMKIGEDVLVLTEPFGRLLNEKDSKDAAGSYGKAGARTETFAIGSVYYTLMHGHEPYEVEAWGRDHFVVLLEKFQRKEFPALGDSNDDLIIRKCWNGEYRQVSELVAEFADDNSKDDIGDEVLARQEMRKMRQIECQDFLDSGILGTLERF